MNPSLFVGIALALFTLNPAFAGMTRTVPAFEDVRSERGEEVSGAQFGIEAQASRAWIEVRVLEPSAGDDTGPSTETVRSKVEGLSFNPSTREIVFQFDNETPVVCAKLVTKKVLWRRYEKQIPTGNCKILASIEKRKIDSGFEFVQKDVLVVSLVVQTND